MASATQPTTITYSRQETFSTYSRRYWRIVDILQTEVRHHMQQTLLWGTDQDKDSNTTFTEFIKVKWEDSTKLLKRRFNKSQRVKMERDYTGATFDVSLLFTCIQVACKDMAPPDSNSWHVDDDTVESILFKCRNIRNEIFHEFIEYSETEFFDKIEEIRSLLVDLIAKAGNLYKKDTKELQEIIDRMNDNINRKRDDPLMSQGIQTYNDDLLHHLLQAELKTSGSKELKERYTRVTNLNPASLITGSDIDIEVNQVFTTLQLVDNSRDSKIRSIRYEEILQHFQPGQQQQQHQLQQHQQQQQQQARQMPVKGIILIEGVSGSGKTTLSKFFISDWRSGSRSVNDLDTYDLLLHMECRNSNLSSLYEFLTSAMPKTTQKFQRDDLLQIFFQTKVLIIVDGLDEVNEKSMKLFQEILGAKNNDNLDILVLTRPEKVEDFYKMISDYAIIHMKIDGIPLEKRGDFVSGYIEALKRQGKCNQDTDGLQDFLESTGSQLDFLWNIPLYLMMVTLLWAFAPDKVNTITTPTELCMMLLNLVVEKLTGRLMVNETLSIDDRSKCKLNRKIRQFMLTLSEVSLESLRDSKVVLSPDSSRRLRQACRGALDLPENDVLGAFLVLKHCWTDISSYISESFPHKGIMDFFAALYLYHVMLGGDKGNKDYSSVIRNVKAVLTMGRVSESKKHQITESMKLILHQGELILPENVTGDTIIEATTTPRSIRPILRKLYRNRQENFQLSKFQEPLIHLLGLVHEISPQSIKELVELIRQSGVKNTNQWLEVLTRVKCDERVARWIAQDAKIISYSNLIVRDADVYGALTLFQHKRPPSVAIEIKRDTKTVVGLKDLLQLMQQHKVCIPRLYLCNDYEIPQTSAGPLNAILKQVLLQCEVKEFRGCTRLILNGDPPSPLEIVTAHVSVGANEDLKALKAISTALPKINCLEINFHVGIPPVKLPKWNIYHPVVLILSQVGDNDVQWAIDILSAIQPDRKYYELKLKHSQLTPEGCKKFFQLYKNESIYVTHVNIDSPHLNGTSVKQLHQNSQSTYV